MKECHHTCCLKFGPQWLEALICRIKALHSGVKLEAQHARVLNQTTNAFECVCSIWVD